VLLGVGENPFTRTTHVFFGVPRKMEVSVRIYDVRGRLTRSLLGAVVEPGYHSLVWDAKTACGDAASPGVYFVRLEAGGRNDTAKAVLAR
jgi:hypothetical protein